MGSCGPCSSGVGSSSVAIGGAGGPWGSGITGPCIGAGGPSGVGAGGAGGPNGGAGGPCTSGATVGASVRSTGVPALAASSSGTCCSGLSAPSPGITCSSGLPISANLDFTDTVALSAAPRCISLKRTVLKMMSALVSEPINSLYSALNSVASCDLLKVSFATSSSVRGS